MTSVQFLWIVVWVTCQRKKLINKGWITCFSFQLTSELENVRQVSGEKQNLLEHETQERWIFWQCVIPVYEPCIAGLNGNGSIVLTQVTNRPLRLAMPRSHTESSLYYFGKKITYLARHVLFESIKRTVYTCIDLTVCLETVPGIVRRMHGSASWLMYDLERPILKVTGWNQASHC